MRKIRAVVMGTTLAVAACAPATATLDGQDGGKVGGSGGLGNSGGGTGGDPAGGGSGGAPAGGGSGGATGGGSGGDPTGGGSGGATGGGSGGATGGGSGGATGGGSGGGSSGPAISAACLALDAGATTPDFYEVKGPDPFSSVGSLFTTGGQYRDSNNGVLQDSWSMLVRWQGDTFVSSPTAHDLGAFTGLTVPSPATDWQRGPQPEDGGSAGVQLSGSGGGLLIDTWDVPHRFIEGGGYNDMFGYAWSPAKRPKAFDCGTDLVLQADLAVPTFRSWADAGTSWSEAAPSQTGTYADGQVDLFAYLEDRAHPGLPPIALVFVAWGNRAGGCGAPGSPGAVGFDYPAGVWFGAGLMCTTDLATHVYGAATQASVFTSQTFFRMHVTRANWVALIQRINTASPGAAEPGLRCIPGVSCPGIGYSTDPDDYVLQYAGVIAELVLLENGAPANPSIARQAMMGARIWDVGIYQYR